MCIAGLSYQWRYGDPLIGASILSLKEVLPELHADAELKRDFGRLVTLTTANVTGKVLNDDDKARINDEALATIQG